MGLLNDIWKTYISIAPYLFLGLVFAGLLHVVFKKDFVAKHLGKNNFFSVIKAAILGVPLPLCSCGVIPTALFLRKKKASKGATLSFLISTPQTGVDSIVATYGMMGPIFAIFRPLAAFVTGIVGGLVTNFVENKDEPDTLIVEEKFECDTCDVEEPHSHTVIERITSGFKYAFIDFLDDITIQLIIGIIIAGFISFIIPDNFFADFGGEGFMGMLLMIAVGIPLYVCATASIPIAVSLILKGISPGAAFVFLVVGPATNAATIALISRALGKKLIAIYLIVIAVFALLGGFLLNYIFGVVGKPDMLMMHHHNDVSLFSKILIAIFSALMILSIVRKTRNKIRKPELGDEMPNKTFLIEGMTCNHCAANVKDSLFKIEGVQEVKINLEKKNAVVDGDYDSEEVKAAIIKAGYKVVE
ncbi:MAG: SO_0444 family Cu/Zn efflux transporter [Candidatus Cloacimonetes bacterium]|nr:SO_0444 family Cu/Zn efflux transporter [Candidatus Cloacimonadota bacterium]